MVDNKKMTFGYMYTLLEKANGDYSPETTKEIAIACEHMQKIHIPSLLTKIKEEHPGLESSKEGGILQGIHRDLDTWEMPSEDWEKMVSDFKGRKSVYRDFLENIDMNMTDMCRHYEMRLAQEK